MTTPQPPKRWSARAKSEVVQRLLRGEAPELVSRQTQVPLLKLQEWRDRALLAMEEGLKERGEAPTNIPERLLTEAQATIGRLTMELEVHRGKVRGRTP